MRKIIAALILMTATGHAVAAPVSALNLSSGEAAGESASEFAVGSSAIAGVTVATAVTGVALMAAGGNNGSNTGTTTTTTTSTQ